MLLDVKNGENTYTGTYSSKMRKKYVGDSKKSTSDTK
jgi:hypothetical protein